MKPLFIECGQCSSKGMWQPPAEKHGNSTTMHSPEQCPKCEGNGIICTTEGQPILDLILRLKRYGKL